MRTSMSGWMLCGVLRLVGWLGLERLCRAEWVRPVRSASRGSW